jgi:uncharacterized membrane protein
MTILALTLLTFVFSAIAIINNFLLEKFCKEEMLKIINDLRDPKKTSESDLQVRDFLNVKGLLLFTKWVFLTNVFGSVMCFFFAGRLLFYLFDLFISALSTKPKFPGGLSL